MTENMVQTAEDREGQVAATVAAEANNAAANAPGQAGQAEGVGDTEAKKIARRSAKVELREALLKQVSQLQANIALVEAAGLADVATSLGAQLADAQATLLKVDRIVERASPKEKDPIAQLLIGTAIRALTAVDLPTGQVYRIEATILNREGKTNVEFVSSASMTGEAPAGKTWQVADGKRKGECYPTKLAWYEIAKDDPDYHSRVLSHPRKFAGGVSLVDTVPAAPAPETPAS